MNTFLAFLFVPLKLSSLLYSSMHKWTLQKFKTWILIGQNCQNMCSLSSKVGSVASIKEGDFSPGQSLSWRTWKSKQVWKCKFFQKWNFSKNILRGVALGTEYLGRGTHPWRFFREGLGAYCNFFFLSQKELIQKFWFLIFFLKAWHFAVCIWVMVLTPENFQGGFGGLFWVFCNQLWIKNGLSYWNFSKLFHRHSTRQLVLGWWYSPLKIFQRGFGDLFWVFIIKFC